MRSLALLIFTSTLVLCMFYFLHSPSCPDPIYITVPPKVEVIYVPVTNPPQPQHLVPDGLVKPPEKPPQDDKVKLKEEPEQKQTKEEDLGELDVGGPNIVLDHAFGHIAIPEPLPPAEMALLGPADKQLSDVAEHLRLLSDCLYVVLFRIPDKLIFPHFDKALNSCMVTLRIPETSIKFYGSGENAKYFIDPEGVTEELKCHIVTLGIDENAKIEKEWMLKFKHCTFFGIDRNATVAQEFYKPLGPVAQYVSASVRDQGSSGDIISLMRAGNVTAPIDQISLKIKALEYSIWDMFFKGGTLDEVSYSVCQWNIGYHQPDDAEKAQFGNFMKKLMKDKRYVPMKFDISEVTNVYYLNIEDPFCILRYVAGRF